MSRALAYCAFRHQRDISLPQTGVMSSPLQTLAEGELRLSWSEVEWPFVPERMQKHALEFHEVVSDIFKQTAVIPFRLLSVFENEKSLAGFAIEHAEAFLKDLERLKDCVQMECVVYPAPAGKQADDSSGAAYLRDKAAVLQAQDRHASALRESLGEMARETRVRESKNGLRFFALMERGKEKAFRAAVERIAVPELLSRRMSGPWPAAAFLSERVQAPQIGHVKSGAL